MSITRNCPALAGDRCSWQPNDKPYKSMQNARLWKMQFSGKVAEGSRAQGSTLSEALRAGCPVGREPPSSEARRARSWSTQRIAPVAALSASASCSVLSTVWAACARSECCTYLWAAVSRAQCLTCSIATHSQNMSMYMIIIEVCAWLRQQPAT